MILFRELTSKESSLVKKWQPPHLNDSDESSNSALDIEDRRAEQVSDDDTTTDIATLRNGIREVQNPNTDSVSTNNVTELHQPSDESPGNHASLTMVSPSPDMLQQTYDEGFAAGALAEKSSPDAGATDSLLKLLDTITAQHYQIDAEIEREVLSLAKAMAKLLIRREVESDDAVMIGIVRNALAQMPITSETPTVVLHPDDLKLIQSIQTNPVLATLVADTEMIRGDCRIESGASILEAGIDALVHSISSRMEQPVQVDSEPETANTNTNKQVDE